MIREVSSQITVVTESFREKDSINGNIELTALNGPMIKFDFEGTPYPSWRLMVKRAGKPFYSSKGRFSLIGLSNEKILIISLIVPSIQRAFNEQESQEEVKVEEILRDGKKGRRMTVTFNMAPVATIAFYQFYGHN